MPASLSRRPGTFSTAAPSGRSERVHTTGWIAVAAGAALLIWPAIVNGYPILFSDTGGFLAQGLELFAPFDKPWIYGPFLWPLHAGVTLWGPVAVQGLILSHLLWLVQDRFVPANAWRHLALCAILAAATSAPWFAALLMPDILAPATVLCLFLLGFPRPGREMRARPWLVLLGAFAIAAHLSHLFIAAACVLATVALRRRWRPAISAALPLALALLLLLATNLALFGRAVVSPHGAVFALARLVADGPARTYLQDVCPKAVYRLCAWTDRLPADSDDFLWAPDGPVWSLPDGPAALTTEAAQIVLSTLIADPWGSAGAALRNTARQLGATELGDTLGPAWLVETVGNQLRQHFPEAERGRFAASRQSADALRPWADALRPLRSALLIAGVAGTLAALCAGRAARALAVVTLVGLLANAFACGALSGPHDRYQARIAWLLLLPPVALAWERSAGWRIRQPASSPHRPAAGAPAPRSPSAASP